MKKINYNRILRVLVCCMLAFVMLAPVEADAAKKKKRKASTTATTTKKKTTTSKKKTSTSTTKKKSSSRKRSTSSTRRSGSNSVTQETQNAAINASHSRNPQPGKQSNLLKIKVDKPDLEEIRTTTLDPANKFYFPKLMKKYLRNDTTMTPEEYRYLYLGYMFQEDYDPYRVSPYSNKTEDLREKTEHTPAEIDTIRKYTQLALLDNPFDLQQMSFLVHALKERRKDMSAKIWEYRLENILGAIKSTGTGEDEDNAWYVIYPMHEYDMVQLLGYQAVDIDYIEPGVDHLLVQPDGTVAHRNPAEGFYFNVLVPQQQYELKHPEEFDGSTEVAADSGDADMDSADEQEVESDNEE